MDESVKVKEKVEEETPIFSQVTLVINHLERYGSISQKEATAMYGITRLAAVIWILRHKIDPPMEIRDVWKKGLNRFGRPCRWKEYCI